MMWTENKMKNIKLGTIRMYAKDRPYHNKKHQK